MTIAAIHLLNQGRDLALNPQQEFCSALGIAHISPSSHCFEVQKIATFIKNKIDAHPSYLPLADAFITRYQKDPLTEKIARTFDRQIAPYRPHLAYLNPANQKNFDKWTKAAQPVEIFRDFPEFTTFLETSLILSQIKVTRDTMRIVDGQPALLVEDQWMHASDLMKRFETVESQTYHSRFVVDKETREVYTYLDNGKGLQKHHPFLSAHTPISVLSPEDLAKTQQKALAFIRPGEDETARAEKNKDRMFVLQYVTASTRPGNSNFTRLVSSHAYMRLVIGKDNDRLHTKAGDVYEIGYFGPIHSMTPCATRNGYFRSPDLYTYKDCEKTVTNIAVTQEEAHKAYQFAQKYHADATQLGRKPGFHFLNHNCSVFAKETCKAAGIEIPTELTIHETLQRILPERIREIGRMLHTAKENIFPQKLCDAVRFVGQKIGAVIRKVWDVFVSFVLIPIRALLGEAFGTEGAAFRQLDKPAKDLTPPLRNWRNWFSMSRYTIHLPGVAREWQLRQLSTVVYTGKDAVKLTIVPKESSAFAHKK